MKRLVISFFLIILSSTVSAVSVGVSPGFVNLDEVKTGTTQKLDFYITTNSGETFEVSPVYESTTTYAKGEGSPISIENLSEQDISSWISFTKNSYAIDPNSSETYELPDGSSVNAEGRIRMEVDIPPNAEPGYRLGTLNLEPGISAEGEGAGAKVIAQTVPGFAFKVSGNVDRNIDFSGVQAVRIGDESVQLIAQFRNSGTVTTRFRGGELEILDSENTVLGTEYLEGATLEPGEYAEIDTVWRSDQVSGGEFEIEGSGSYSSGETYISDNFVITDTVEERQEVERPTGNEDITEDKQPPITLILILTILSATLLYLVDINTKWILIFSGGLLLVLYIALGPASNTLLLIPLISIGLMIYI